MKLDDNASYELTKVAIKNEDSRYFKIGDKTTGPAYMFGECLVVGSARTSPVLNIAEQGDGKFLIETKNSVYTLDVVK